MPYNRRCGLALHRARLVLFGRQILVTSSLAVASIFKCTCSRREPWVKYSIFIPVIYNKGVARVIKIGVGFAVGGSR